MNKKLIAPIVTAAAMLATSVGSTFALFSSKASSRIDINAGKLEVKLTKGNAQTYSVEANESGDRIDENGYKYSSKETAVNGVFTNGGTATFTDCNLELDKISPGDRIVFDLNASQGETNIIYKYRVVLEYTSEDETIGRGMEITTNISGESKLYKNLKRYQSAWAIHDPANPLELDISFDMELPVTCGNEYQDKAASYSIYIEAVQGNAAVSGEEEIEYFPFNGYGFYDSKEVDGHWVHEITNVAEFRNIVTNEGNTVSDQYPGYGDYETVYLIKNDIDFGDSAIWTIDDPIQDFVFNGSLEGINEDITLEGYHLNDALNDEGNMGIFPMARHASFKNLVLDDFVFQNDAGINCGFFAGQTEDDNYNADRVLRFENIIIKDTCSINSSKSIGSLMGLARGCFDFEAKNVINNASIFGDQSNIAGFVGQASAGSVPAGTEGSWTFENCINNGDVTHIGGGNISGFVNQLQGKIVLTIKNCEQNGKLSDLGQSVAYFTNNSADKKTGAPTTVKEIRFEGTNKVTSEMYTKNGLAATTEAKAEPKAMAEQSSAFAEGSVNNYGNPNNVMENNPLTLTFDESNHLKVEGGEALDFDYSTLSIKVNGRVTISVPTNLKTGEGSKILYVEKRASSTLDYSDITKVMHLGYCTPSAAISMPSYQNPYSFYKYYIPYEKMETVGFGTRYDTDNGLAVIDNTGKTRLYESIQNVTSIAYKINLFKNDGTFVGTGDLTVTDVSPFVF